MSRGAAAGISGIAGLLLCTVGPCAFADRYSASARMVAASGGYLLVLAQSRSSLPWTNSLPAARVIRRLTRVGVYLVPVVSAGFPLASAPAAAVILGFCVGLAGVLIQLKEIRVSLSRRYLRLLPPIDSVGRWLDIVFFGSAGAAQEYLYRGLIISALYAWPVLAIGVSTLAFVIEHLMQTGAPGRQWDRKDIAIHCALSIAFGAIVVIWRSLPAAMIGHTIYNSPNVLQSLVRRGAVTRKKVAA